MYLLVIKPAKKNESMKLLPPIMLLARMKPCENFTILILEHPLIVEYFLALLRC
jgi:hypothetical protein